MIGGIPPTSFLVMDTYLVLLISLHFAFMIG